MKASSLLTFTGILCGVLLAFVIATCHGPSSTPSRRSTNPPLLPEADGAITEIVMHFTPSFRDVVWTTYTDFWSAIDGEVRLNLIVADDVSEAERARVLGDIGALNPKLADHTRWISTPGPITTWSKDRALVSEPSATGPALLWVPEAPGRSWPQRYNDWQTIGALTRASSGRFERRTAPFDFDAGDFAVTGRTPLFDISQYEPSEPHANWDVSPDGTRFVMVHQGSLIEMIFVLNWPEEVRRQSGAPSR